MSRGDDFLALATATVNLVRLDRASSHDRIDIVAVEEPIEVRVGEELVATTMRTPGHDEELVAGLLWAEGILQKPSDLACMNIVPRDARQGLGSGALARVVLSVDATPAIIRAKRGTLTSAACGVCGRGALDDLLAQLTSVPARQLDLRHLAELPHALRAAQSLFEQTGGVHGAALLDEGLQVLAAREDVGRHNAVDKAVGRLVLDDALAKAAFMVVSGRTSFELVHKGIRAGVSAVVGVSAPSSLAVELARTYGVALLGFAREGSCNVYAPGTGAASR